MCTCTLHSPQELRRAPRNRFVAVSPLATAPTAEEQEEGGWRNRRVTEEEPEGMTKREEEGMNKFFSSRGDLAEEEYFLKFSKRISIL